MKYDIYIACCTPDGGVAHAILDETGDLTLCDWVKASEPMYLAWEGDQIHTLLRNDPSAPPMSGVTVLPVCADGSLGKPGAIRTTGGEVACHLSVVGGTVYAANYVSGSVSRIADGETVPTIVTHTGSGPHPTRQTKPHTHYIAPSPDGRFLLATDLGLDAIYTYDADLREIAVAHVPAGHGARHLIASPDGRIVYCANELAGTVTAFAYADGRLTPLATVSVLPADFTGKNTTAAIRSDGRYLYVSNRGHDSIAVVETDGDGGMTLRRLVPCGGNGPRDFDLFGEYLLCTNEDSETVTVLRRQEDTLLPCGGGLSLPHPLCVIGRPITREEPLF